MTLTRREAAQAVLAQVLTGKEVALRWNKDYKTVVMACLTDRLDARQPDGKRSGWLILKSSVEALWGREVEHE